jgi:flagellar FliL protein
VAASESSAGKGALLGIVLASLLAIGLGVSTGWYLSQRMNLTKGQDPAAGPASDGQTGSRSNAESTQADATAASGSGSPNAKLTPVQGSGLSKALALSPIMTSIAKPQSTWIRLEAALIVASDEHGVDDQLSQVGDDMLAYLRTVELSQIEGPSGLRFLKDDLLDRARTRTGGQVRDVVIKTLVVE